MFRSEKEIEGVAIGAVDGTIGKVEQLVFDDRNWAIRYIVVDIGSWLSGKRVLLSPAAIDKIGTDALYVKNSKDQIKNSPSFESIELVSRQEEMELHDYYSWPYYWAYPQTYNSLGGALYPGLAPPLTHPVQESITEEALKKDREQERSHRKSHLRETKEVRRYTIMATDEEIGRVGDFITDMNNWVIRYLVIEAGSLFHEKKFLIAPQWTGGIDWGESVVYVIRDSQTIRNAPAYDSKVPITRDYEEKIYDYYKAEKYWER